ncbi:apolipoprotein A-II [Genypterus blacodes]|uniref:apolipoprotein A-II n=1 Tax=Genypterus blacodes TaxID=154954 RepID=UPI003F76B531
MNGKYALALILALQVSMSLCEVPVPGTELVLKYNTLKETFYKKLMVLLVKMRAVAAPLVEQVNQNEEAQVVRGKIGELINRPEYEAAAKIATGVVQEATPLVDKARSSALGVYEMYLRPHFGSFLDSVINHIKVDLDQALPAE